MWEAKEQDTVLDILAERKSSFVEIQKYPLGTSSKSQKLVGFLGLSSVLGSIVNVVQVHQLQKKKNEYSQYTHGIWCALSSIESGSLSLTKIFPKIGQHLSQL